jgi:hypothetical protein
LGERIVAAWGEAGQKLNLNEIMQGLDQFMSMLQLWSKKKFGNILREQNKARKH